MNFTKRELELIQGLLEGKTDDEIRESLFFYNPFESGSPSPMPQERYRQIKSKVLKKTRGYIERIKTDKGIPK